MSAYLRADTFNGGAELALAPLRHPALEQVISSACEGLPITRAYLAAVRDPLQSQQTRLLLAVSGSDTRAQRQLAALIAGLLPDDLEMDLIELEDDSLSQAVHVHCQPFYCC